MGYQIFNADVAVVGNGASIGKAQAILSAYSALTAIITLVDTPAPTTASGTQILSQTISLSATTSKVEVDVSLPMVAMAASGWIVVAVFCGTTLIDVASFCVSSNNFGTPIHLKCPLHAPGASSATYSVYIGPGAAGTVYVNGSVGAAYLEVAALQRLPLTKYEHEYSNSNIL